MIEQLYIWTYLDYASCSFMQTIVANSKRGFVIGQTSTNANIIGIISKVKFLVIRPIIIIVNMYYIIMYF